MEKLSKFGIGKLKFFIAIYSIWYRFIASPLTLVERITATKLKHANTDFCVWKLKADKMPLCRNDLMILREV